MNRRWHKASKSVVPFIKVNKFEDTKEVMKSRKSKDRKHNDQKKRTKGQTTIDKPLHKK